MSQPKVLIADKMDPQAESILKRHGVSVDIKTGLSPEDLAKEIANYDGVAVRSSAKITGAMLKSPGKLKVIGRAGIGVDTIDVSAATAAGVVVMNTPFGNSITTAEHTIAMMMALARQIPQASQSTHMGKWEKSKFMGVELYGKILGVIGCGNIGAIVASRAMGLQMNVIGYDPFLSEERARELGIKKVDLDALFADADFITLHVPKTESTSGMIDKTALSKMKKDVRIINCARGGLIIEQDLKDALDSGHVAGAALDVFEIEPAQDNCLFGHPSVICTPHLGASTSEAQVNVAIQVAEQLAAYLLQGAVSNAVNMPSISAEEAPKLKPWMSLGAQLGRLAGQICDGAITKIHITYSGKVAAMNTRAISSCVVADVLKSMTDTVNLVNAPEIAKSRNITIAETKIDVDPNWSSAVTIDIHTESETHSVTGTLFANKEPRLVMVDTVPIEAALMGAMLFIRNDDKPGLIGAVGTLLGQAGQNIADFRLGRVGAGRSAIALVTLDQALDSKLVAAIAGLPQVQQVKHLLF